LIIILIVIVKQVAIIVCDGVAYTDQVQVHTIQEVGGSHFFLYIRNPRTFLLRHSPREPSHALEPWKAHTCTCVATQNVPSNSF
jgi:hypothetical protein